MVELLIMAAEMGHAVDVDVEESPGGEVLQVELLLMIVLRLALHLKQWHKATHSYNHWCGGIQHTHTHTVTHMVFPCSTKQGCPDMYIGAMP